MKANFLQDMDSELGPSTPVESMSLNNSKRGGELPRPGCGRSVGSTNAGSPHDLARGW